MDNAVKERAADIVNAATGWQLNNISELSPPVRELVEKATAVQAEYINTNGGLEYFADDTNSMSLGSFSYTKVNSGAEAAGRPKRLICSQAEMYLEQTGLMYRGTGTR